MDRAARLFYEVWDIARRHNSVQSKLVILGDLAVLALARGQPEGAAPLLGARDQLFAQFWQPRRRDDPLLLRSSARRRARSDRGRRPQSRLDGRCQLSLDEAYAYARSIVVPPA